MIVHAIMMSDTHTQASKYTVLDIKGKFFELSIFREIMASVEGVGVTRHAWGMGK